MAQKFQQPLLKLLAIIATWDLRLNLVPGTDSAPGTFKLVPGTDSAQATFKLVPGTDYADYEATAGRLKSVPGTRYHLASRAPVGGAGFDAHFLHLDRRAAFSAGLVAAPVDPQALIVLARRVPLAEIAIGLDAR